MLSEFFQEGEKLLAEFESQFNPAEPKDVSEVDLAKAIDHTLLKPDASLEDIQVLCDEAAKNNFFSVCVNPVWVKMAASRLFFADTKICTVVSFPLGSSSTESKVKETEVAIEQGADEIDMVISIGMVKSFDWERVIEDIRQVTEAAHPRALLKVIIETSLLTDQEKVYACMASRKAGADFVKTSTGFSGGGATARDIALMKFVVGGELQVKASGGVRDYQTAITMIANGADRIGASSSLQIIQGSQL